MFWTNKQGIDLFTAYTKDLPGNTKMIKKSETDASMFIDEFQLSPKPDVKTLAKRFERLVNGKPGHKRNAAYIANCEGTEFYRHIDEDSSSETTRQTSLDTCRYSMP